MDSSETHKEPKVKFKVDDVKLKQNKQKQNSPLNENGKLKIPIKTKRVFTKDEFEVISLSGKGAYGTVVKAKFKLDKTDTFYAIKIMDVAAINRINKLYQAYLECDILCDLQSPYIVNILGSFFDGGKIYIVMDYLSKGDFSDFLRLNYPLKEETIRFYAAEIVNFLDYIQSKNVVHRDLKPENIMMNSDFHLQVIDFATARILGKYFDKKEMVFKDDSTYDLSELDDVKGPKQNVNPDDDDDDEPIKKPDRRGMTFVGTAEYVSPEVLGDQPAGFGSDVWALGIMLYQMYCGKTPFKDKTNYLIFKKIAELKIEFPPNVKIPDEAKDLITKILVKDSNLRLGGGGKNTPYSMTNLKNHPYFKGIDWKNLHQKTPPFKETFDYYKLNKEENKGEEEDMKDTGIKVVKSESYVNSEDKSNILRVGYLQKKSPWFHYNKRKIILDTTPKIIYIDPESNQIKGEIFLDKSIIINHIDMDTFELVASKKTWRFKGEENEGLVWERSITEAIKNYAK